MKNKYLTILLGGLIALSVGCKKDLDLQPTDFIYDDNVAFQTISDLQLGANEAYARYGAYLNDMYVNALLSDEAKLGANNSGQGEITYRYQFSSDATSGGDVTGAWFSYYRLIDQANRVLEKVNVVTAAPEQEPKRNIIRGQMLAMRAIGHFGLLQAYCKNYNPTDPKGVPIMLETNRLSRPARKSMGEAMAQIEADLDTAKVLLSDPNVVFSDTAMNRENVTAFHARIALYKRDYEKAIQYATDVINSGVTNLAPSSSFERIWADQSNEELLFRVRYANSPTVGGLWTTSTLGKLISPSDKLTALYSETDIRRTAYIDDGLVAKYLFSPAPGRGLLRVDLKAIRISEMYLIRAEAHALKATPDLDAGTQDLNTLRTERIDGYTPESFPTASALMDAIIEERYKEFAFEGFRFYDLKRYNLPVQRSATDASNEWATMPIGSYRFVLPIPNSELLANPNMVQNDGY
jgi:hypothetical protein